MLHWLPLLALLALAAAPVRASAQPAASRLAPAAADRSLSWESHYGAAGAAVAARDYPHAIALLNAAVGAGFVSDDLLLADHAEADTVAGRILRAPGWAPLVARVRASRAASRAAKLAAAHGMEVNPHLGALRAARDDSTVSADSAYRLVSAWSSYPRPRAAAGTPRVGEHLHMLRVAPFGDVPFLVHVPPGYDPSKPHPLVLYLHGAAMRYVHSAADGPAGTFARADPLLQEAKRRGYLVLIPVADRTRRFAWVYGDDTFLALAEQIRTVKRLYNVDDRRVYAVGHSDGGRGAYGLAIKAPSQFAGFVGVNLGPSIIRADNFLRNLGSRPSYWVHSDLDDINPLQDVADATRVAQVAGAEIVLKTYRGFTHDDAHVALSAPDAFAYLTGLSRTPFPSRITWETADPRTGRRDWLEIARVDTSRAAAPWHDQLDFMAYDKLARRYTNEAYYRRNRRSGAVRASYRDNRFDVELSRVDSLTLYISPLMVNLAEPVTVVIGGDTVFHARVRPDKALVLDEFARSGDRQAVWIARLTVAPR